MSANDKRKLLGKSRRFGSRAAVYQTDDGLDLEINEQYDVVQRRVLFDDVMMVTIHRQLGALHLFGTGFLALLFIGLALLVLSRNIDAWPAAVILGIFGAPALLSFLVRLFLGLDVITVFGRRSKATIHFAVRKRRAREVYGSICGAVRSAHRRAAASASTHQQSRELPDGPSERAVDQ